MRNFRSIIIVLFISLLTFASQSEAYGGLHSYKGVSVLDKGSFVKIRIKESGVYKLTYEDLNAMGINPQKVKVYGYGGALLNQSFLQPKTDDLPELAIHMEKVLMVFLMPVTTFCSMLRELIHGLMIRTVQCTSIYSIIIQIMDIILSVLVIILD